MTAVEVYTSVELREALACSRADRTVTWCLCPITEPCGCGGEAAIRRNTHPSATVAEQHPWVLA